YTYSTCIQYTHIHIHTMYLHISHMYTLVPIAYSTYHYYILYTIYPHTHTLTTCTTYYTHPYIYTPLYILWLYMLHLIYTVPCMYYLIHRPLLYTHAIYTPPICYPLLYVSLLYSYPLYTPLLYKLPYILHTYINRLSYKHSLITISHICHTQDVYKYIYI